MRIRLPLPAAALLALALSACVPNAAFRTDAEPAAGCTSPAPEALPAECRAAITETTPGYDLHFVEFDDQGWTYPPRQDGGDPRDASADQLRLVMERLHAAAARQRIRIFVFVHGWKHNAAFDDANVVRFRDFLDEAARYELAAQSGTRVVGVYVGWPGRSLAVGEPLLSATFWDRKIAAQHVAVGSVRELTAQLRALQREANRTPPATVRATAPAEQRVRIHLIGHSFGGLALYAAVSQSLVYSFVTGEDIDGRQAPVERLGDLVVLINPAFEATRYQPLDRVARNRSYRYYQSPVFVAFTSEADAATGVAFPLGRTVNTLFERENTREEGAANRNTPGHVDPYLTHRLATTDGSPAECAAWALLPDSDAGRAANIDGEFANSQARRDARVGGRWPRDDAGRPRPVQFCGGLTLTPLHAGLGPYRDTDPNMPLWNVTVDAAVIGGHNDIHSPIFRAFLRQLFRDEDFAARTDAVPAAKASLQLPR